MGDMADDAYDMALMQEGDRQSEIQDWLNWPDEVLLENIKEQGFYKSEFTTLVRNIVTKGAPFSEKQRFCIAAYLTDFCGQEPL